MVDASTKLLTDLATPATAKAIPTGGKAFIAKAAILAPAPNDLVLALKVFIPVLTWFKLCTPCADILIIRSATAMDLKS